MFHNSIYAVGRLSSHVDPHVSRSLGELAWPWPQLRLTRDLIRPSGVQDQTSLSQGALTYKQEPDRFASCSRQALESALQNPASMS
jgi:hypothetical protein